MTIARSPGDERADVAGWPWSHRKDFLERLAARGYAAVTIQEYRKISGRFCEAIEKRSLQIGDLDCADTVRLRHSVLSGVTRSARTYAKFCARRFIDHLTEAGAPIAPPPAKNLTALDCLREEYETHLRKQRGLAESTMENCRLYMRRFLRFRFGDKLGTLNAIPPDVIVGFLGKLKTGSPPHSYRSGAVSSAQLLHVPVLERQDKTGPSSKLASNGRDRTSPRLRLLKRPEKFFAVFSDSDNR